VLSTIESRQSRLDCINAAPPDALKEIAMRTITLKCDQIEEKDPYYNFLSWWGRDFHPNIIAISADCLDSIISSLLLLDSPLLSLVCWGAF
jgi:hypothetical protein